MIRATRFFSVALFSLVVLSACQRAAALPPNASLAGPNDMLIADTSSGLLQVVERMKAGTSPCHDSACERAIAPLRNRAVLPNQ